MSPEATLVLETVGKLVVVLVAIWGMAKWFGAPLLKQTVREALAPELDRLEAIEHELGDLRRATDAATAKASSWTDVDRRVSHNSQAVAQLPSIRTSLDYLTGEMGRANSLNERGMAMIQDLAVQVGRLQGGQEEMRRRVAMVGGGE